MAMAWRQAAFICLTRVAGMLRLMCSDGGSSVSQKYLLSIIILPMV